MFICYPVVLIVAFFSTSVHPFTLGSPYGLRQTTTAVAGNDGTKFPLDRNIAVHSFQKKIQNFLVAAALSTAVIGAPLFPANALESQVIGQITGSGLVFKDTLQVESFEDPKIRGVTLYISNFQRPINERLSSAKNFFSDPSSAAVACARTGKRVTVADNINMSPAGEEVFKESKSLLFKSLKVQRIFDKEHNTVVYVSFNTRFDKNDDDNKSRFQNSLCAINLDNYGVEPIPEETEVSALSATTP